MNTISSAKKERWELYKDVALTFSALLTPLIVAVLGGWYNLNIKDSENRVRYVELAIELLRAQPTQETAALRAWAVEVLERNSPVGLAKDAKEQLKSYPLAISLSGKAEASGSATGTLSVLGQKKRDK